MITDNKLSQLIQHQFPNSAQRYIGTALKSPYLVMQAFANFTKDMISVSYIKEVKHCFDFINVVYTNGSKDIKNAIEKVYVELVSTSIDLSPKTTKEKLHQLLPQKLKTIKAQQQHCLGIY